MTATEIVMFGLEGAPVPPIPLLPSALFM